MEAAALIKYGTITVLALAAFALMLTAYFWFLFAVAVPVHWRFEWWFDRFNVSEWPRWKRGLTALAFFVVAVVCDITAARIWMVGL